MPLDEALCEQLTIMKELIRAESQASMTLYRMTSDVEFVGPLLSAIEGMPITYPAFMSTSDTSTGLSKFVPRDGHPLLLEIECPPQTRMGLMEAHQGAAENECLLGCGTKFVVNGFGLVPPEELGLYLSASNRARNLKWLKLTVSGNPPYTATNSVFSFSS